MWQQILVKLGGSALQALGKMNKIPLEGILPQIGQEAKNEVKPSIKDFWGATAPMPSNAVSSAAQAVGGAVAPSTVPNVPASRTLEEQNQVSPAIAVSSAAQPVGGAVAQSLPNKPQSNFWGTMENELRGMIPGYSDAVARLQQQRRQASSFPNVPASRTLEEQSQSAIPQHPSVKQVAQSVGREMIPFDIGKLIWK
jgi:hypothetical protein